MTVAELILWVDRAIEAREASYVPPSKEAVERYKGFIIGNYALDNNQALAKTTRGLVTSYEKSIASLLMQWGNDVADWKKIIDKENQFNFTPLDRKE